MGLNHKSYPSYKPSGIPWLGKVPVNWDVMQVGRIGVFLKGHGGTKEDQVHEGVPCIRYGDIYTSYKFHILDSCAFVSEVRALDYTPIQYGDVLFAGSGESIEEIGKSAVNLLKEKTCCGGDVILFRPDIEINARFSGYAIDSPYAQYQKSCMGRGITVMHIYSDELKYLWIALPPLPEQAAIVRYLDHIDERIRRYVSANERLIRLLEEKKQAVIDRAVTRGLDSNVRPKPSSVRWLPNIPTHWEVLRLKALVRIRYGLGQPPRESATGLPLIRATNIERGRIIDKGLIHVDPSDVPAGRDALLKAQEIIVVRSGAYTADSAIIPKAFVGAVAGYDMVVTVTTSIPQFVAFVFLSKYLRDNQWAVLSTRSAQPHLNAEELGSALVLVPPIAEQAAIVEYLHKATTDIESAITRTRRQIELLQEYRTRLISDLVTGKLDVRDAVSSLPAETNAMDLHCSVAAPDRGDSG